jgi:DNA-binding NtrC family response regulator
MLADRFRVVEAENPQEGLDQLSNGVDVVVADLEAAKSDGLELLRQAKGRRPNMPVLAVTNGGDVNAAVEAMKLGAADCLVKPLKAEQLQEAVSQLLGQRRSDAPPGPDAGSHIDIPPGTSLEDLERAAVEQALAQHQGNRTHAAKTLGISVRTLQRKLKAWGIPIVSPHSSARSNHFIMPATGGNANYSAAAHSAH